MVKIPPSKNHTKTFDELTYEEQSKSISAKIISLGNAIKAHQRRALSEKRDSNKTLIRNIGQLSRLIERLTK